MDRTLDGALRRVERCDEVYIADGPLVRLELRFGIFKWIYLAPEGGRFLGVPT